MPRKIPRKELAEHNKQDSLWLAVNGTIYDLTEFSSEHPGGVEILYKYAGRDATAAYNEVHAPSLISKALPAKDHIGSFTDQDDGTTLLNEPATATLTPVRPPLEHILSLHDFEAVAQATLSPKSFAYIHGGSNDNITRDANAAFLQRIWLRPALLCPAASADGSVNMRTTLFSMPLELPVYIAPMGATRSGGAEGDVGLARGASTSGVALCISTASSFPYEEILEATTGHCFFQLYVNKDRQKTAETLRVVEESGKVRAVFVTVDLPAGTKRESAEREKLREAGVSAPTTVARDRLGGGFARRAEALIDPTLRWEDLTWLRSVTKLPLLIKGVQRSQDAKKAMEAGCDGIVISNHGGRAADCAPPAILTLLELHRNCPEVFETMKVLVDGGFRRGSDIVKAVCLGAAAVGLGRPFLYSIGYGHQGVEHAVEIIRDEIDTAMRLCGIADLMQDASPDFVNTADIDHLVPQERHPYARKVVAPKLKL